MSGVTAAVAYGLTSMMAVFLNKSTLSVYEFRFPVFLTIVQSIVTLVLLAALKHAQLVEYAPLDGVTARKLVPVTLASIANVSSGLMAVERLSLPMFSVLRRLGTFFVMTAELLVMGKRPPAGNVVSVSIWIMGACIAAWADLYFTPAGYAAAMGNNAATAIYTVLVARMQKDLELSPVALLRQLALVSLPFQLVLFAVFTNEPAAVAAFPAWHDPGFLVSLAYTSSQGVLLSYTIFLCVSVNSAATTSITGQIKTVLQSFLGIVFFAVHLTPLGYVGLSVSTFGVVVFVYSRIMDERAMQRLTPAAPKTV